VKDTIRKNQIQDLQEEFSKTAIEPGKKIYVIRDIDKISAGAANSLLKFLEEPYPDIHAILTTSNINRILPTIISRSQVVSFSSLQKHIIEQELRDAGYEQDHARLLAQLTNNAEDAMAIADHEWFLDVIDAVTDIYRMLAREEAGLLLHFNRQYDILYQDKDTTSFLLSCMILYHKDIIHVLEDDANRVVFQGELDQLSRLALQHPKQRRIDELERMLSLQGRLRSYINERLAFDNLLLELERR
jgi:DNA polymerase-3 subunit delta'